jgi:hypothetical protein
MSHRLGIPEYMGIDPLENVIIGTASICLNVIGFMDMSGSQGRNSNDFPFDSELIDNW